MKAHYPGKDNQELIGELYIDGGWRLLFSVPVLVEVGDIVQAFAEFEVTNDTGRPVGVFSVMKLQSTAVFAGSHEMNEANGHNVTPDMHHGTFTRSGSIIVPDNMGGAGFVNLWVRAVQTQTGLPPLTVEKDFGRMFVNVFAPIAAAA